MSNKYPPILNPKFYLSIFYYIVAISLKKKISSIHFFEKSLQFAPMTSQQYLCNRSIGVIYYSNDFFAKAKSYLQKAENIGGAKNGDTELYTFLGLVHYTEGNNLKAIEYFEKALSKYGKLEWIKKDFITSHLESSKYKLSNDK